MLDYNTQLKKLPLPEYGRSIQNMVDYALTLKDREERQRCAKSIINIMGNMFPHLRDVPDFKHMLWDHLAIMANFELDIDYPYELVQKENLNVKPESIDYPNHKIRYRHYGNIIQRLINEAVNFEEGDEKDHLIAIIASQMRKSYTTWNKDSIDENKIADDLLELSGGKLRINEKIAQLIETRHVVVRRPRHNNPRRYSR